ncbi:MAG: N-acetylmuramoyl-L-alanine amidase [Anaerovoracaceae bacterium]|nr:N-acetylmuramoyl-L-alanine amidase [Anaerovoracaceae bacterium]
MPNLFLSPSVQEFNPYVNGLGTEEYYMNLIADAMEPYLIASGITFTRNSPDDTLRQVIALSNAGNYDFHLALHSNASPESLSGQLQGSDIYYYATSSEALRAALIFESNLKVIYPDPSRVKTVANTTLAELRLTRAPANLIELAYHDNLEDATWIINNIPLIARTLVLSLTEYFGIPFREPQTAL